MTGSLCRRGTQSKTDQSIAPRTFLTRAPRRGNPPGRRRANRHTVAREDFDYRSPRPRERIRWRKLMPSQRSTEPLGAANRSAGSSVNGPRFRTLQPVCPTHNSCLEWSRSCWHRKAAHFGKWNFRDGSQSGVSPGVVFHPGWCFVTNQHSRAKPKTKRLGPKSPGSSRC